MRPIVIAAGLSLAARLAAAQAPVPLYDNLGTLTHRISSRVPRVQQYFDQGLRLTYGFNHAEAIRAFEEAARLDSTCAICFWGAANAWGPNINLPMDSAAGVAAYAAIRRAVALRDHASPAERGYIDALAVRFAADPKAARAPLDSAYAEAMAALARRFPADPDAATLAAAAQMERRPWNYWQPDSTAYPGIDGAVARLEGVLRRLPNHPGACHYYIHLVEASRRPERALPCARRLGTAMPGAGHLVHMPAHVFIRLGMYDEARKANIHAAHADESYRADTRPDGFYLTAYYPHNLHFLWVASAFQGRYASADSAMRRLREAAPVAMMTEVPPLEFLNLAWYYHLVWFGRWEDILREGAPPAGLESSAGMWRYARGRAFSALGRAREAAAELDSLHAITSGASHTLPANITLGFASPAQLLGIAEHVLAGELASRAGRHDDAVMHLREAVRGEDALTYNEPADWYPPTRLALGAAQLAAGRAADAEATYREELAKRPNNGWTLQGLEQALRAQGKAAEAARVAARLRRVWAGAGMTPAPAPHAH